MRDNDLLLITDMQNVYKKGGKWECLDTEGVASKILKIINSGFSGSVLLTEYIAQKNPYGVWKDYNDKYKDVNEDVYANCIVDELKHLSAIYPVYEKGVYSSLDIAEVKEACLKSGRVVITGVVAECCVLSTVFALMDAGIYVVYLTDAVSGLTKAKEDATVLVLSGLSPLHVKIMTTDEYMSEEFL